MKKQILTFAVLATIAVGAAVMTTSAGSLNVKPETDFTPNCKQAQPCHVGTIPTCTISSTTYVGSDDQPIGSCDQIMELN